MTDVPVLVDTFTGADGDPLDTEKWTATSTGDAPVPTIQGNAARMERTGSGIPQLLGVMPASVNQELLVKMSPVGQTSTTDSRIFFHLRANGVWSATLNMWATAGYHAYVSTSNSTLVLRKMVGGSQQSMTQATATKPYSGGSYWMRFRVEGTAIKVKFWDDASSEPGSWQIETADSSITAPGVFQVGVGQAAGTWDLQEVTVSEIVEDDTDPANVALSLSPASAEVNDNITATATVANAGGNGVSGVTVTFAVDGVTEGTGTTNASGQATLTFTRATAGDYDVTASAPNSGGTVTSSTVVATFDPEPPPADPVTWLWLGALQSDGVTCTVKTTADASVRLAVSTASDMTSPVYGTAVTSNAANFNTVKPTITGLTPGTVYHYAVEVDGAGATTKRGQFRTKPADGVASYTLGVASCALGNESTSASNHIVFANIRAHNPLFFIHMGDLHYYDYNGSDPAVLRGAYQNVMTSPRQGALWRNTPTAYVWDDHDFGPNNSHSGSGSKTAARTAYRQCVPHYPLAEAGAIYHAFTVGRVRYVMLDCRSERVVPDVTVLGATQKAWLYDEIDASAADPDIGLTVIVTSVPWISGSTLDTWSDFATERQEIQDYIINAGMRDKVCMLAGDMHAIAIDDGSHNTYGTDGLASWPLAQFAAMDAAGSTKGGPYSQGPHLNPAGYGQFGLMTVTDDGDTITVDWSGRQVDPTGTEVEVAAYSFTVDTTPAPSSVTMTGAPATLTVSAPAGTMTATTPAGATDVTMTGAPATLTITAPAGTMTATAPQTGEGRDLRVTVGEPYVDHNDGRGVSLHADSTEYVHLVIGGRDASSLLTSNILVAIGNRDTWLPVSRYGETDDGFRVSVLVGPDGVVELTPGIARVWVRIIDNPERPVILAGSLVVNP